MQFCELFAGIKYKQHVTVKSRLLSCTRSCSERDGVYAKLDIGGLKMEEQQDTLGQITNKYTNCKGVKNNTNFGQIAGIQEKLDTTCK